RQVGGGQRRERRRAVRCGLHHHDRGVRGVYSRPARCPRGRGRRDGRRARRRMTAAPFPPYGWGSVRWVEPRRMTPLALLPYGGGGAVGGALADDAFGSSALHWGGAVGGTLADDGCAFGAMRLGRSSADWV